MQEQDRQARQELSDAAASAQRWLDRNGADLVCDFCAHLLGQKFATYVLDEPIVETLAMLDTDSMGAASMETTYTEEWAACEQCDPIVAAGDAAALAEHAVDYRDVARVGPIRDEAATIAELKELYEQFFARNPQRREESRDELARQAGARDGA